jgi:hypothetical protein
MATDKAKAPPAIGRSGDTNSRARNRRALPHRPRTGAEPSAAALRCRRRFTHFYPGKFRDEDYVALERDYKWNAHQQWNDTLGRNMFRTLMEEGAFTEIASRAVKIESRTNLLFSFEKMALRDAVKSARGAAAFARGLYDFLHGPGHTEQRFNRWVEVVAALPRKQTRVLTWPLVTVFGFIAQPDAHLFLKPNVTRRAAREYGFDFDYVSRPAWPTYRSLLDFGETIRRDLRDWRPRDMIDIQSFIWVQGSDEYD